MKRFKGIIIGATGVAAALLLGIGVAGAAPAQAGAAPSATAYAQAGAADYPNSSYRGFCRANGCADDTGRNYRDANGDGVCDNHVDGACGR